MRHKILLTVRYRSGLPFPTMRIVSAASALPAHYYPQKTLIEAFRKYWGPKIDRFDILERLHSATQVDGRYLAFPLESYPLPNWGDANNKWIAQRSIWVEEAIEKALAQAGVSKQEIGAFFFVSITGIASPSIEARLINRMGLNPRMKRIPIFGLGCVAGAAGIARAADYVRAFPKEAALLLSVELCSLTIQPDDLSVANLISSGLFGDGAAAVVIAGAEYKSARSWDCRHPLRVLPRNRVRDGMGHLRKGLSDCIFARRSGGGTE